MARIDWVEQRLRNWALWHERGRGGGTGYASQAAFLNIVNSTSRYRESRVPVDEVEASITNEAVETLLATHPHLHRTLQLVYLDDSGIKGAALAMNRAESTIHAHLSQADVLLAAWFTERKRAQEARRKLLETTRKSFTP